MHECYYSRIMPPETGAPSITPMPAHMGISPLPKNRWGAHLLILITLTFVFAAFFLALEKTQGINGSVTLLVRSVDGGRSVETLSLANGSTALRTDIDPKSMTTISTRTFELSDGSVVTLAPAGVIRKASPSAETGSVLVASTIQPALNTPLAVWGDGALIAWRNPADGSVQVFVRSARGAYVPFQLFRDVRANSLGFTEDGSVLVVGVIDGQSTSLYALSLENAGVHPIETITGFVSVVPTP